MRNQPPVTMLQIAERAGVHPSSVSRALSPSPTGVSEETVQRVRQIAAELGFHPHPAATALRTGRTGTIGVIVPRLTDFVLARIYEGIDAAAHAAGFNTIVAASNDDPALRREILEQFLARRVEGVVVGDARLDGDEIAQQLRRGGVPYVLVNRRLAGHPSVTTDDVEGGRAAALHLLRRGHRIVGVVAGPDYASTCIERSHGFVNEFLKAGVSVPSHAVRTSTADVEGGHRAAVELLNEVPELTAVFAINDFAAIGAVGALRELGRRPGTDVAIVGFNDIPLARYLPLPLSSVASEMFEMGRGGAEMLIGSLDGGHVSEILLPPVLHERETSDFTVPS